MAIITIDLDLLAGAGRSILQVPQTATQVGFAIFEVEIPRRDNDCTSLRLYFYVGRDLIPVLIDIRRYMYAWGPAA